MKQFSGFVPIITRRNIPDALFSLRRQVLKSIRNIGKPKSFESQFIIDGAPSKKIWTRSGVEKFLKASFEYQMDYVIDAFAYWYFQFLLSWEAVQRNRIHNIHFIDFDTLINDEVATLNQAARFVDKNADLSRTKFIVEEIKKNHKESILLTPESDKKRDIYTEGQKDRLRRIASYFANEDVTDAYLRFKE
jgi:hypothetical protein